MTRVIKKGTEKKSGQKVAKVIKSSVKAASVPREGNSP
jgi:hypothetical protein